MLKPRHLFTLAAALFVAPALGGCASVDHEGDDDPRGRVAVEGDFDDDFEIEFDD